MVGSKETAIVVGKCPLCDGIMFFPFGRNKKFGPADQSDAHKGKRQHDAATNPSTDSSKPSFHASDLAPI